MLADLRKSWLKNETPPHNSAWPAWRGGARLLWLCMLLLSCRESSLSNELLNCPNFSIHQASITWPTKKRVNRISRWTWNISHRATLSSAAKPTNSCSFPNGAQFKRHKKSFGGYTTYYQAALGTAKESSNTNLLVCCSKFILSVHRFAPLYEAENWIKQERVSSCGCCEETHQCACGLACACVVLWSAHCLKDIIHHSKNVTSHSGDAWKENQASPPLSWRRVLQWQVSTLADSHPIIFRPAVLQTAGKWTHSWC